MAAAAAGAGELPLRGAGGWSGGGGLHQPCRIKTRRRKKPKTGKSGKSSKEGQDIIESECYCLRAGATELEITTEKY